MANPDGALIDNAISKKPQVVQIDAGDKAFKTSGCQPWQLTPDATLPSQASTGQVQGTLGILGACLVALSKLLSPVSRLLHESAGSSTRSSTRSAGSPVLTHSAAVAHRSQQVLVVGAGVRA